jgi:hypothetical protein
VHRLSFCLRHLRAAVVVVLHLPIAAVLASNFRLKSQCVGEIFHSHSQSTTTASISSRFRQHMVSILIQHLSIGDNLFCCSCGSAVVLIVAFVAATTLDFRLKSDFCMRIFFLLHSQSTTNALISSRFRQHLVSILIQQLSTGDNFSCHGWGSALVPIVAIVAATPPKFRLKSDFCMGKCSLFHNQSTTNAPISSGFRQQLVWILIKHLSTRYNFS